ncbi:MAG: hypothetical protein CME40_16250 [Haliea sp.]|nr:hypothetical protein [Haliea sp.]|tara:strand:- start:191082 stop:191270 length:189 start_codon:yes stop_codon:yes gene_type:complete
MSPQHATQKERERADIARQVDEFLRQGGEIRVVQAPAGRHQPRHPVTWLGRDDFDLLAERGI